jgi:hypothetical protein
MGALHEIEERMIDERCHIGRIDNLIQEIKNAGTLGLFWNGVGSNKPILRWFKPPEWVRELFAEASIFHDVAYIVGGTKDQQDIADEEFGVRCWRAVSHLGFFKRKFAMLWMNVNDDALKNFGRYAFDERDAPCYELDRLLMEVEL